MKMSIPVYLMIPLILPGCESNNTELNPSENTEFNIQTDNGLCPSSQSIAREAIAIVNLLRATGRECGTEFLPAAAPLAWNELLEQVAKSHSDDMATHNFFSHTGSDGSSPGQRLTNADYNWQSVGENISTGLHSLQETIDGLVASAGHCANIMNSGFIQMGMACSYNDLSDNKVYWTQVFATPK